MFVAFVGIVTTPVFPVSPQSSACIMLRSLGTGLGARHGVAYRPLLRQPLVFRHYTVESGLAAAQEVKRQTASFYISNVLPIQVGKFE